VAKNDADEKSKGSASKPATKVELLNPNSAIKDDSAHLSSGAEADVEDGSIDDIDPDQIEASPAAKKFAEIPIGDYVASKNFVGANPQILTSKDTDGLLVEAFNSQMDGKEKHARQCVHQALLLQYCRQLGKDGVALFFQRVTTKGHQANKLFTDDVQNTYLRIKNRVEELKRERSEDSGKAVEQIQLHAVDPNTTINIRVPPPIPQDLSTESTQPPPTPEDIAARQIFESFPPNLQRALELASLDEVNRVLGKMSVDEAEEVVAKLSEGGILSVEEGVVDATTEEGQRLMEEIERTGHIPGSVAEEAISEDPPLD
jgi:cell division cycle protein 37